MDATKDMVLFLFLGIDSLLSESGVELEQGDIIDWIIYASRIEVKCVAYCSQEMMATMRLSMSEMLRRMTETYSHMYLDMGNLSDNTASNEENDRDDDNGNC